MSQKTPNAFQEKVSGIVIVYPTLIINVIETSLETIKDVLRDLVRMHNDPKGLITESKIICLAHEISLNRISH